MAALGATFVAFGIAADSETITFKVQDVGREELIKAIEPFVASIEDVREVTGAFEGSYDRMNGRGGLQSSPPRLSHL